MCYAGETVSKRCAMYTRQDQLFGVLARAIVNNDTLLDPSDINRVIHEFMAKPSIRSYLGRIPVLAERLLVVRNWKLWTDALHSTIEGGLLSDLTSNHFFMFVTRRGLPVSSASYIANRAII